MLKDRNTLLKALTTINRMVAGPTTEENIKPAEMLEFKNKLRNFSGGQTFSMKNIFMNISEKFYRNYFATHYLCHRYQLSVMQNGMFFANTNCL